MFITSQFRLDQAARSKAWVSQGLWRSLWLVSIVSLISFIYSIVYSSMLVDYLCVLKASRPLWGEVSLPPQFVFSPLMGPYPHCMLSTASVYVRVHTTVRYTNRPYMKTQTSIDTVWNVLIMIPSLWLDKCFSQCRVAARGAMNWHTKVHVQTVYFS